MNIRRPPFSVVSHLRPRFAFLARSIRLFALFLLPALALAENPKQSSELAAKKMDDGILFQCSAPGAEAVYLAGDFNNWAGNTEGVISDAQYKMDGPDGNGVWRKTITLAPGTHKFKFNIGGRKEQWFGPEWAKQDADGNALITITESGEVEAAPATDATAAPEQKTENSSGGQSVTFKFTAPDASSVYLAGDFNNWADNKDGTITDSKYALTKGDDGVWKTEMAVPPGRHSYKFVVDGNRWEADPGTSEKDASGNSVVEVK